MICSKQVFLVDPATGQVRNYPLHMMDQGPHDNQYGIQARQAAVEDGDLTPEEAAKSEVVVAEVPPLPAPTSF